MIQVYYFNKQSFWEFLLPQNKLEQTPLTQDWSTLSAI